MSKFFIRNGGSWVSPQTVTAGTSTGNQPVEKIHYRDSGAWEEVWPLTGSTGGAGAITDIVVDVHYALPTTGSGSGNFGWQFFTRYPYDDIVINTFARTTEYRDISVNPQFRRWFHPEWKLQTFFGNGNTDDIVETSSGDVYVEHLLFNQTSTYTDNNGNAYQYDKFRIDISQYETKYPSSDSVWTSGSLPREYSNSQGISNDTFHFGLFGYYWEDTGDSLSFTPATTNPVYISLNYLRNPTFDGSYNVTASDYSDTRTFARYSKKLTSSEYDIREKYKQFADDISYGGVLTRDNNNLTTYDYHLLEWDYNWNAQTYQQYAVNTTPPYTQTTLPSHVHTVLKVDPDGGAVYSGQNGIWNSFNHTAYIDTNDQTAFAVGNVNVWLEALPWDTVEQGAETTTVQYLTSRGGKDSYAGLLATDAARPIPDRVDAHWWLDGNWGFETSTGNILEGLWSNHFSVVTPPPGGYSWSVNGYGEVEPPYSVFNIHQYQWDNPTVANVTIKIGGFWAANASTQTTSASVTAMTFTSDSDVNKFGISNRATTHPMIQADGDDGVGPIGSGTFSSGFIYSALYGGTLGNITHQGNTSATISTTNSNGNAYIGPPAPSKAFDQNVFGAQSNFGQTITTIFIDYVNNTITVS